MCSLVFAENYSRNIKVDLGRFLSRELSDISFYSKLEQVFIQTIKNHYKKEGNFCNLNLICFTLIFCKKNGWKKIPKISI